MKITRRSFVKKTSYGAAAVTGTGLGGETTSENPLEWETWEVEVSVTKTVTVTSSENWDLDNAGDQTRLHLAMLDAMGDPSHPDTFTESDAGMISVDYDHGHGGSLQLDPPMVTHYSGDLEYSLPIQSVYDSSTGLYSYTICVMGVFTFKLRKTHRV